MQYIVQEAKVMGGGGGRHKLWWVGVGRGTSCGGWGWGEAQVAFFTWCYDGVMLAFPFSGHSSEQQLYEGTCTPHKTPAQQKGIYVCVWGEGGSGRSTMIDMCRILAELALLPLLVLSRNPCHSKALTLSLTWALLLISDHGP